MYGQDALRWQGTLLDRVSHYGETRVVARQRGNDLVLSARSAADLPFVLLAIAIGIGLVSVGRSVAREELDELKDWLASCLGA
ncbi:MAG TPA: hypothetical protein VJ914_20400 [Pseudonocardiaceae bacterium]|nr:hypothetical protein [Pseudonocardiaceae bacterium]